MATKTKGKREALIEREALAALIVTNCKMHSDGYATGFLDCSEALYREIKKKKKFETVREGKLYTVKYLRQKLKDFYKDEWLVPVFKDIPVRMHSRTKTKENWNAKAAKTLGVNDTVLAMLRANIQTEKLRGEDRQKNKDPKQTHIDQLGKDGKVKAS